jgi:hypothetical protein
MRDILKNPMFYYVLAPVLVGLWPLLVWFVYLPRMGKGLDSDIAQYGNAASCMSEILTLDPERVNMDRSGAMASPTEFGYGDAVNRVADRWHIGSRNCTFHVSDKVKISGKQTQEAKVILSDVDIVQACNFLSTIQSSWVNLECQKGELKKKEGAPDRWDVDLSFKYTY